MIGPLALFSLAFGAAIGLGLHQFDRATFSWWFVGAAAVSAYLFAWTYVDARVNPTEWEQRRATQALAVALPVFTIFPSWIVVAGTVVLAGVYYVVNTRRRTRRGR